MTLKATQPYVKRKRATLVSGKKKENWKFNGHLGTKKPNNVTRCPHKSPEKPRATSETKRFQRRTMSDISLTFPSSIQCEAVSWRRQKYLWICLHVTQTLRDAGSFRGGPQLWGRWWGAWTLGHWMVITGAQIMDDWRLFLRRCWISISERP